VGAVLSKVKVFAVPVKGFPALSVAVACTVYVPSLWDAQAGRVAAGLPQVTAAPFVVAALVAARLKAPMTQVELFQYRPSAPRLRVKVVLLAAKPRPSESSAALPRKVAGTLLLLKLLPSGGLVTDDVVGGVQSLMVCVRAAEMLLLKFPSPL